MVLLIILVITMSIIFKMHTYIIAIILGIYAMNKNNMMGIHCLPFCTLQHIINGINYICFVTYKVALTINIRHFIRYLFILDKKIYNLDNGHTIVKDIHGISFNEIQFIGSLRLGSAPSEVRGSLLLPRVKGKKKKKIQNNNKTKYVIVPI